MGRRVAALLCVLLGSGFVAADQRQTTSVERLAWLAGCWAIEQPGYLQQEQWMAPAGGTMIGMSRTVSRGQTVEYEHLRIEERGGKLVYYALPAGQREASFVHVELTDASVVFENPEHDFPQRIRYRHLPDGTLQARIEGLSRGENRVVDFPFQRQPCDGVAP